jgi:hypothetical protein
MQLTTEIAQREGSFIVEQSKALIINTPEEYAKAAEGLKLIKGYASRIDTELILPWRKQKASAEAERKRLTELLIDPLKDAEQILKRKQIDYVNEQERKRKAEERRLQAEADARAEKEREEIKKNAEKIKTPEIKELLLKEVEQIKSPVIEVSASTPKISGQSIRTIWKIKITDYRKAIMAISQWIDALDYIKINEGELNRLANKTKGKLSINGVEVYEDKILRSSKD